MSTSITGQGISIYPASDDALSSTSKNPVQNKVIDEEITDVKNAIDQITQPTKNLFDERVLSSAGLVKNSDGYWYGKVRNWNSAFSALFPVDTTFKSNTRYTVSCSYYFADVGTYTGAAIGITAYYTDSTNANLFRFTSANTEDTSAYNTTTSGKTVDHFAFVLTDGRTLDYVLYLKDIQVEEGIIKTDYIQHLTAMDLVAEEQIRLAELSLATATTFEWQNGNINSSGNIENQNPTRKEQYSNKVYGLLQGHLKITYATSGTVHLTAFYYGTDGYLSNEVLINTTGTTGEAVFSVPSQAVYVIFVVQTWSRTFTLTASDLLTSANSLRLSSTDEIKRIQQLENAQIVTEWTSGYIDTSGYPASPTSYKEVYSGKIYGVLKIDYDFTFSTNSAQKSAIAEYDKNGDFLRINVIIDRSATRVSGTYTVSADADSIVIYYRTFDDSGAVVSLVATYSGATVSTYGDKISEIISNDPSKTKIRANQSLYLGKHDSYYDHIFVDKLYGNAVIPSESLYNVSTSRRLGYTCIEGNVHKTSDNNYVVMHGENGTFGQAFSHVDGTTDITNVAISSVTLQWIKTNVRYTSKYAKYRVAPPTLQEFLMECKKHGLIPLMQVVDVEQLAVADQVVGQGNYIVYTNNSKAIRKATTAMIYGWNALTTKDAIVDWVKTFAPCSYGMANPSVFTDAELSEIVDAVHAEGGYIHFAYGNPPEHLRLHNLGFDFSGALYGVNDFDSGNKANLFADTNFSAFTTNGTVSNTTLTLTDGQTITPSTTLTEVFLGKGSLHIRFEGTLHITMGSYIDHDFTSDGTKDVWLSTYFIEAVPTFEIIASGNATVYDISYKASEC